MELSDERYEALMTVALVSVNGYQSAHEFLYGLVIVFNQQLGILIVLPLFYGFKSPLGKFDQGSGMFWVLLDLFHFAVIYAI